jgi:hypothetical protein
MLDGPLPQILFNFQFAFLFLSFYYFHMSLLILRFDCGTGCVNIVSGFDVEVGTWLNFYLYVRHC